MLMSWTNIGKALFVTTVFSEIILYYVTRFKKQLKSKPDYQNKVMFFSDNGIPREEHSYKRLLSEETLHNMRWLVKLLEKATSSLDICIYLFTCQELSEAVLKVHRKGVNVRIIVDGGMITESGSQIRILRKCGVPVRMKKSPYLMHHKFAVINNDILVTGSCNWTMQGFTGNWENMLVTSVPGLVLPFSEHFSQMWKDFTDMYQTFEHAEK